MSNQATWMSYKDVVSVAAQRCQERAMQEIHSAVLGEYAEQACIEFARRSEVVFDSIYQPLIPNERLVRLPHNCAKPTGLSMLYPGDTNYQRLSVTNEKNLLDWRTAQRTGRPFEWTYSKDRKYAGLYPIPTVGGFDGLTTAGVTTSITLETGASTTDDTYNDMTVTVLSGTAQGGTSTVSDYVGLTKVLTIADSLSVGIGARIQIGRTQLLIEFQSNGNPYAIQTLAGTVTDTVASARHNLVPISEASMPIDHFKGCEVRFSNTTTTTALQGVKTRVTSSYSRSTGTALTVFPDLGATPVNGDVVEINSVPNTPDEYHHYLSHYVVYMALERIDRSAASSALLQFERGVEEAKRLLQPLQGDEYETLRGGYWDDY